MRLLTLLLTLYFLKTESTTTSSLQNLQLNFLSRFPKSFSQLTTNCASEKYFYVFKHERVQKWDYKSLKMVQSFQNPDYFYPEICICRPQLKQLLVVYYQHPIYPIVIWNEENSQIARSIDTFQQYIFQIQYSLENNEIILTSYQQGNIYFLDYDSLEIKQSYSTRTISPYNQYATIIYKRNYCPTIFLAKQGDQNLIILDSNVRPFDQQIGFSEMTILYDAAHISQNCQDLFYMEKDLQITNQAKFATLNKRSKSSNFSEKRQIKFPVVSQVVSMNMLFQQKQTFLLFSNEEYIFYDHRRDQISINKFQFYSQNDYIQRVYINEDERQIVVQMSAQFLTFQLQCKRLNYFSTKQLKCFPCQVFCLQCSAIASQCSSCEKGFFPQGRNCLKCILPCETCEGSSRNCTSCPPYHTKYGNQCVMDKNSAVYASSLAMSVASSFQTRASVQFISFLNELWPYFYHKRNYSKKTNDFLQGVRLIQSNKWLVGGFDKKINFTYSDLNFSVYNSYSNEIFLQKQDRSSYFWDAAFQFCFYSVPMTLIFYFSLNIAFIMLYNYSFSVHIRKYGFLMTIFVSVMQSNLIYNVNASMNNITVFFFFKFQDKIGHIASIIIMFLIVIYAVAAFFLIQYIYQKLGKYFIEECRLSMGSFIIYTVTNTKGLFLGALQAFLHNQYEYQIWAFIGVEILAVICVVWIQVKFRCFKQQSYLFTAVLKQIMMVTFNFFLWVDYKILQSQQNDDLFDLFDTLNMNMIYIITGTVFIKIIVAFFPSKFERNSTCQTQQAKKARKNNLAQPFKSNNQQNVLNHSENRQHVTNYQQKKSIKRIMENASKTKNNTKRSKRCSQQKSGYKNPKENLQSKIKVKLPKKNELKEFINAQFIFQSNQQPLPSPIHIVSLITKNKNKQVKILRERHQNKFLMLNLRDEENV